MNRQTTFATRSIDSDLVPKKHMSGTINITLCLSLSSEE